MAGPTDQSPKGIWPLQSLNFFMADMQAGIGPFLGVFLLAHGWESGLIGTVMTIGGIAGMIVTTPAVRLEREGVLADVAPTALQLLGLAQPPAMTGRSLADPAA